MQNWRNFFDELSSYEIQLNNHWAELLKEKGLSLRNHAQRGTIFQELGRMYQEELAMAPDFIKQMPAVESNTLQRTIRLGADWQL
jgi:hypothetical protein